MNVCVNIYNAYVLTYIVQSDNTLQKGDASIIVTVIKKPKAI